MVFSDEQIDMVVEFWTRVAHRPKQQMVAPDYRGSPIEEAQSSLVTQAAALVNKQWQNGQREKFGVALREVIRETEMQYNTPYNPFSIRVDYHPDRVLTAALLRVGFNAHSASNIGLLPIKTTTRLNHDGSIDVYYGYGDQGHSFTEMAKMDQWLTEQGH